MFFFMLSLSNKFINLLLSSSLENFLFQINLITMKKTLCILRYVFMKYLHIVIIH